MQTIQIVIYLAFALIVITYIALPYLLGYSGTGLAKADYALLDSSVNGSMQSVREALAENANVNALDDRVIRYRSCRRPLECAAQYHHSDIAKLLIDSGADVNAENPKTVYDSENKPHTANNRPLFYAVAYGDYDLASYLIVNNASLDATGVYPLTYPSDGSDIPAFFVAFKRNDEKMVKLFIDSGADINATYSGVNPLGYALKYRNTSAAELAIDLGADINAHDPDICWTPMDQVIYSGDGKIEAILRSRHAMYHNVTIAKYDETHALIGLFTGSLKDELSLCDKPLYTSD